MTKIFGCDMLIPNLDKYSIVYCAINPAKWFKPRLENNS